MANAEDKKPKAKEQKHTSLVTWGPVAALVVVVVIYVLSQLAAALILSLYPALKHWSYQEAQNWLSNSNYAQFFLTVLIEGLTLTFLWLFLKRRKTDFRALGLRGYPKIKDIAYSLLGLVIYIGAYYIFLLIVVHVWPSLNVNQKQDVGFSSASGGQLWLVFISLVLLPPIVEEILFRGFLYTGLRSKFNKIGAALIVSIFFASLHLSEGVGGVFWIGGMDIFILSLVLCYLREKTDKLWAPIGLHMMKNFLAFASLFLFHVS